MNQLKFLAVLLLSITILSCNKKADVATGVGDALIVTRQIGSQTVYGISLYAYSFSSFKSVTATTSADVGKLYTLKPNQGYATNFFYEAPDTEYSTTKPTATTFNFSAVFNNGATDGFTDELSSQVLDLPHIVKCEYNSTTHQLEINWDLLTNADSYAIDIMDGSTLLFGSTELANTIKAYAVSTSGDGWANGTSVVNGKTYTVRLMAFLYEPGGDSYNVQATSVSQTTVVWGN